MSRSDYISVGSGHELHYTTQGLKEGPACLFLHGGPGIGTQVTDNRFFDLNRQWVIRYDQRGCGLSRYKNPMEDNTSAHHVEDMRRLLDKLNIEKVHLVGGSWGSTLALLFMITSPERVHSAVLRGYFSADRSSLDYFMSGCNGLRINAWQEFMSLVPEEYTQAPARYYAQELVDPSSKLQQSLAGSWIRYVMKCARTESLITEENLSPHKDAVRAAALQAVYTTQHFFLPDRYIVNNIARVGDIPITIIHGIHDVICPISYAEELVQAHASIKLIQVAAAHTPDEPGLERAVRKHVRSIL